MEQLQSQRLHPVLWPLQAHKLPCDLPGLMRSSLPGTGCCVSWGHRQTEEDEEAGTAPLPATPRPRFAEDSHPARPRIAGRAEPQVQRGASPCPRPWPGAWLLCRQAGPTRRHRGPTPTQAPLAAQPTWYPFRFFSRFLFSFLHHWPGGLVAPPNWPPLSSSRGQFWALPDPTRFSCR